MDKPLRLADPQVLREFIKRHGLAPRKGLGQHWLQSEKVIQRIIRACGAPGGILEIGPGPGVLTTELSNLAPTIAIDIDERVESALKESAPKARFVQKDVLKGGLAEELQKLAQPRIVVSNLPYYITAAIVTQLCSVSEEFDLAVLMMQEEVALKLCAAAGDPARGSLSVFVQHSFEVEKVSSVPPSAFLPSPKVNSTVLRLSSRRRKFEDYLNLVRIGFKQPRKTLANNLKAIYGNQDWPRILSNCGIDPLVRPHQLSEQDWRTLARDIPSPRN